MRTFTYADWLEQAIASGRLTRPPSVKAIQFSLVTSLYEKSVPTVFAETRDSVLAQSHRQFEWIILAHGPISDELRSSLRALESEDRCKIFYLPENLGIIGAMRFCLDASSGDYITPLDGDDLLTRDALEVMAEYIATTKASFLYSDEDHLVDGVPQSPYLRPDFDPVLLKASSYIWHMLAFRRDHAREIGVYSDTGANWCHDWDTALRFYRAGYPIAHVPAVLHHWRAHAASSTNRPDPESGSMRSQRHVLQREIDAQSHPEHFSVEEFPLFRGAKEWWIRRLPVDPPPVDLVLTGRNEERIIRAAGAAIHSSQYPFRAIHVFGKLLSAGGHRRIEDLLAGQGSARTVTAWQDAVPADIGRALADTPSDFTVFCGESFRFEGELWPWECDAMFQLHADVAVVAARVLTEDRTILGGAEIFGFDGVYGCPDQGRAETDPGYYAFALKQHSVSAPFGEAFIARTDFVRKAAEQLPPIVSWPSLGAWFGGFAAEANRRVAFTPLVTAVLAESRPSSRIRMSEAEAAAFIERFQKWIPDNRWYSPLFGWQKGSGFALNLNAHAVRQAVR